LMLLDSLLPAKVAKLLSLLEAAVQAETSSHLEGQEDEALARLTKSSFSEKMAPGVEATTAKTEDQAHRGLGQATEHGGNHGVPHHEGKGRGPHGPVLIEEPGTAQSSKLDGKGLRVTIIATRWYDKVLESLVEACSQELLAKGVAEDDLHLVEVAGAFEIPFAAARLVHGKDSSHRPDAVVCIGCIVKDATHMSETMSQAVANGIMKLNVTSDTPMIFGVLCCNSEGQAQSCAEERECGEGRKCNHGVAWAQSALEMAHLKRCAAAKKLEHCACVRCVGREGKKQGGSKHTAAEACTTCGCKADQCSCKDCKCQVCRSHRGECATCKSSTENCSCDDCKCRSCCAKRQTCRGCGCPPDKCSCQGCNCAACCSKDDTVGMKMPMPSSEHATMKEAGSSAEHPPKHESSASGGGAKQGGPIPCATCGSPGGKCKCGLLH